MTGVGRCAEVRLVLGVYVLGAAEPAERTLVRMHLARCRDCREELAGLAGLPGLLRRVPPAEADNLLAGEAGPGGRADPPADGALPGLFGRAARTRRIRRWLALIAAAAAVVLAAGSGIAAGGGFGADRVQRPAGPLVAAKAPVSPRVAWKTTAAGNDLTGAAAIVRYAPAEFGTQLAVRVSGVAPGTTCELRVIGPGGHREIAGAWTVVSARYTSTWIEGSVSFPVSGIRGFTVVSGRKILVSVPVEAR
jgi:putative zinc finger protein